MQGQAGGLTEAGVRHHLDGDVVAASPELDHAELTGVKALGRPVHGLIRAANDHANVVVAVPVLVAVAVAIPVLVAVAVPVAVPVVVAIVVIAVVVVIVVVVVAVVVIAVPVAVVI